MNSTSNLYLYLLKTFSKAGWGVGLFCGLLVGMASNWKVGLLYGILSGIFFTTAVAFVLTCLSARKRKRDPGLTPE